MMYTKSLWGDGENFTFSCDEAIKQRDGIPPALTELLSWREDQIPPRMTCSRGHMRERLSLRLDDDCGLTENAYHHGRCLLSALSVLCPTKTMADWPDSGKRSERIWKLTCWVGSWATPPSPLPKSPIDPSADDLV
jgi:hypothetical protein|uniref:Uncharacterized protein n=1 Tax=Bionectria ochroleuca TaxID=29856 RepID=A0A8H7TW82_BIOOC